MHQTFVFRQILLYLLSFYKDYQQNIMYNIDSSFVGLTISKVIYNISSLSRNEPKSVVPYIYIKHLLPSCRFFSLEYLIQTTHFQKSSKRLHLVINYLQVNFCFPFFYFMYFIIALCHRGYLVVKIEHAIIKLQNHYRSR